MLGQSPYNKALGDNSDGTTVMTLYTGIVGYTALPTRPYVFQLVLANERACRDSPVSGTLTRPWGVCTGTGITACGDAIVEK